MERRGYSGQVTLRSPSGESVTIKPPGRFKNSRGQVVEQSYDPRHVGRRLRQLFSAGWKVVACNGQPVSKPEVGEEEKKNIDLVVGTTQTGDASHGGNHASKEVRDSPNAAKQGEKSRKCRGGQKKRRDLSRAFKARRIQVQKAKFTGSVGVYSPQPLEENARLLASAERSAEFLAELVGRSHLKVRRGVSVNTEKLLIALEIGDNPLPPIEYPAERPKLRILVTPDCSGSCQGWSGLGQAWALHLSRIPDVDVTYVTNSNGEFWGIHKEDTPRLIEAVDVVLYLGDGDGRVLCERYASLGATVLALDCFAASVARPRLKSSNLGQGALYWVDRVCAKTPETWSRAIELCLAT